MHSVWSSRPAYAAIKALLDTPLPVGTLQGTGTFSWPTSGVLSAGTVGKTGITTGPHLHFELHDKGARVDPEAYLP
ncbi:MAG: M23 family metallopeptidase [Anaerolineae bacterium]|nr:M23 family metallopeptidase [Anaerolineae bacterium]